MYMLIHSRRFGQLLIYKSSSVQYKLEISRAVTFKIHWKALKGKGEFYGYDANLVEFLIVLLDNLKSAFLKVAKWTIL